MKVGERGQVTIPKNIREKLGLQPRTEVQFELVNGALVLRKVRKPLPLRKWKGKAGKRFASMGFASVDEYLKELRGR